MSMEKGEGKIPVAMAVTVALSLGYYVFTHEPLKSSRPVVEPVQSAHSEAVPAWLWQDPLQAAVSFHERKLKGAQAYVPVARDGEPRYLVKVEPDKEEVLKRHDTQDLADEIRDRFKKDKTRRGRDQVLAEGGQRNEGSEAKPRIEVLIFMVDGAGHGTAHERRLRDRYAAVTALAVSCYIPEESDKVKYVVWRNGQDVIIPYEWYRPRNTRKCNNSQHPTLVVWLRDDFSAIEKQPVSTIRALATELVERVGLTNEDVRLRVVGPQSSSGLRAIVQESPDPNIKNLIPVELYSPHATIPPSLLLESLHNENDTGAQCVGEECHRQIEKTLAAKKVVLKYEIGTDRELLTALVEELERRGVRAGVDRIAMLGEWDTFYGRALTVEFRAVACAHAAKNNLKEVTEDVRRKRAEYCGSPEEAEKWQIQRYSDFLDTQMNLPRTSYLRGLDGLDLGNMSGKENDNRKGKEALNERNVSVGVDHLERPDGESQYDYIRRIAEQLRESAKSEPIRAIVILGSDVYDQLLVLQALRKEFPATLFLTTDLDTRFWQPDQIKWARNLIVASHFGLELDSDLQRDIPPFRDSYQTALFFAVLRASGYVSTNCERENIAECSISVTEGGFLSALMDEIKPVSSVVPMNRAESWVYLIPGYWGSFSSRTEEPFVFDVPVRLYEIGRNGPVDISVDCPRGNPSCKEPHRWDNIHPDREQPSDRLAPLILRIMAMGLLVVAPVIMWRYVWSNEARVAWDQSHKRILKVYTSALVAYWIVAGAGICKVLQEADEGEPLSVFDGVSMWPTVIIKAIIIVCGIIMLVKVREEAEGLISISWGNLDEWIGKYRDSLRARLLLEKGASKGGWSAYVKTWWLAWWIPLIIMAALIPAVAVFLLFPDQWGAQIEIVRSRPSRGEVVAQCDKMMTYIIIVIILPLVSLYTVVVSSSVRKLMAMVGLGMKDSLGDALGGGKINVDIVLGEFHDVIDATRRVIKKVYWLPFYPLLPLLLLILGRNTVIDAWSYPAPVWVTWLMHGGLIVWSAWMYHQAIEGIRDEAIERLQCLARRVASGQSLVLDGKLAGLEVIAMREQVFQRTQEAMEDVRSLKKGGFVGVLEQPVVATTLLVILAVLQHFLLAE